MKTLISYLPDVLYDEIKELSHKLDVPMAEIVRQRLREGKNLKIITNIKIKVQHQTNDEWSDAIKKRDLYICSKCCIQGEKETMIAHHIKPRKLGGRNTMDNGLTLCRSCHNTIHIPKKNL